MRHIEKKVQQSIFIFLTPKLTQIKNLEKVRKILAKQTILITNNL